nr:hypothetical protein [Tanacetum cinerariifolium]
MKILLCILKMRATGEKSIPL